MTHYEPSTSVAYLDALRGMEMIQAVRNDWDLLYRQVAEEGHASPLDTGIGVQASLDLEVARSLDAWSQGETIPRNVRRFRRYNIGGSRRDMDKATALNLDFIDTVGYDKTLNFLGQFATLNVRSQRYPSWHPTNLEMWIRQGSTFATFQIFEEFMARKRAPMKNPSTDAVIDSLLDVATVSESLRTIQGSLLESPELPPKRRDYIRSLGGLLLEYDALIALYEDREHEAGSSQWHFPAPPSMDYGRNTAEKGDIVTYYFDAKNPRHITYTVYDVKSKHTQQRRDTAAKKYLSGVDIGCARFENGKTVVVPGTRSDDFLDSYLEEINDKPGYGTVPERLARGLAVVAATLPYLHLSMHAVSQDDQCSLPAPYRPQDKDHWISLSQQERLARVAVAQAEAELSTR